MLICDYCEIQFDSWRTDQNQCGWCNAIVCDACSPSRIPGIPLQRSSRRRIKDPCRICNVCILNPGIVFLKSDIQRHKLDDNEQRIAEYCIHLIKIVNQCFPVSSTRQAYWGLFQSTLHPTLRTKKEHLRTTEDIIAESRNAVYDSKFLGMSVDLWREFLPFVPRSIGPIEDYMRNALKYSSGNCSEMAYLCFLDLLYQKRNRESMIGHLIQNFYVVHSLNQDHQFALIEIIKLNGERVRLVCDPWYKSLCFEHNLFEYYSINGIAVDHHSATFLGGSSKFATLDDLFNSVSKVPRYVLKI